MVPIDHGRISAVTYVPRVTRLSRQAIMLITTEGYPRHLISLSKVRYLCDVTILPSWMLQEAGSFMYDKDGFVEHDTSNRLDLVRKEFLVILS